MESDSPTGSTNGPRLRLGGMCLEMRLLKSVWSDS